MSVNSLQKLLQHSEFSLFKEVALPHPIWTGFSREDSVFLFAKFHKKHILIEILYLVINL